MNQLLEQVHQQRDQLLQLSRFARVDRSVGLLVEADGLQCALGTLCYLQHANREIACEVVGFSGERAYLMPLAPITGVDHGALLRVPTRNEQRQLLPAPESLLGRIVDGLCQPVDGLAPLAAAALPIDDTPINPMQRLPIDAALETGVGSIDSLLTVGCGQRLGLFAGSGVGKSVLLGMLARFVSADVVVVGLIGERGREVREFIVENLGAGLAHSVVVACPADDSPALRLRGATLATQIAEAWRDRGKNVLLLMDSLTRVAQAQREIGLALGEPPTTKGYTPSSFACLPKLVERAGRGAQPNGSITAFYTVLMEEDDLQDPVVDAARAILDGHLVLDRQLADQGLYPAIDVGGSVSRVMNKLVNGDAQDRALAFKALWQRYREQEDLISLGAYRAGADPVTDQAIALYPAMCEFLRQSADERIDTETSARALAALFEPSKPVTVSEKNMVTEQ